MTEDLISELQTVLCNCTIRSELRAVRGLRNDFDANDFLSRKNLNFFSFACGFYRADKLFES